MSNMYIIGGANGAGKTTVSMEFLKNELQCPEFVNADNIAVGLSPFRPDNAAISAGKIMLTRISSMIESRIDFAIETTLSSKTLEDYIIKAKKENYNIIVIFIWLDSPELAVKRVKQRVESGGHNIPDEIIKRRYHRGLINFFNKYIRHADYWLFVNNSGIKPSVIAEGTNSGTILIYNNIWSELEAKYGKKV